MPGEPTRDDVSRVMKAMSARANQPREVGCARCGKAYIALRPRGRYCSASCRAMASQERRRQTTRVE